jgi:uncharacterized membrane protein YesL
LRERSFIGVKKIFDMDNPLMQALSVAADLLALNILALLCCLPIVTAGAGITAMNDLVIHMARQEETYLVKPFFRSFRANFKQSSLLWLLILAAAALLYFDYHAAAVYAPMLRYPIAAIGVMLLAVAMYAFALLSRYENSVFGTLKNAVSLAIGFFPRTLGMVVFTVAFWVLAIHFYRFGVPVLVLFGLSLPCYICALLLRGVFDQLEK